MTRLVKRTESAPKEIDGKWYCMCGLSANQPFCDSSHKKLTEETQQDVYLYDKDLNQSKLAALPLKEEEIR